MNSYDSVHLMVPRDRIDGYNSALFATKAEIDENGEVVSVIHTLKKGVEKPLGLSRVSISDKGADMSFSAKLLCERYVDGLNLETVGSVARVLNPFVQLSTDALLSAELWSIDSTDNIRPRNVRRAILSVGTLGSMNSKYRFTDYGGQGQQGFVFQSRAKTVDERLIGYDKVCEMTGRKESSALGLENFTGVLRIEQNIRHRKQMRDFLGLRESYTFRDALESTSKPNVLLFEKIIGGKTTDNLAAINRLQRTEGIGVQKFKNIGIDAVIEKYGGNWKAVEKFIRLNYAEGSNPSRMIAQAKQRLALYHESLREAEILLDEVNEIRERLKAA